MPKSRHAEKPVCATPSIHYKQEAPRRRYRYPTTKPASRLGRNAASLKLKHAGTRGARGHTLLLALLDHYFSSQKLRICLTPQPRSRNCWWEGEGAIDDDRTCQNNASSLPNPPAELLQLLVGKVKKAESRLLGK
jgi:hypothetical protein